MDPQNLMKAVQMGAQAQAAVSEINIETAPVATESLIADDAPQEAM